MIGRMYRPLKIHNIAGKRGFTILHKYKSNNGGIYEFETEVYLNYDAEKNIECVQLKFNGLDIPVLLDKGLIINDCTVKSRPANREIYSLRKLNRPTKISSKEKLDLVMTIESSKNENENDVLEMSFSPTVVDYVEYMKMELDCRTAIFVHSESGVEIQE